ncbi:MAG TPA: hypothetical protein VLS93_08335 [Anaeromyxobacteraceae bacterium]|nr:hypothetical protein [Anaeromyxobacteraceae bacterium]
MKTTLVIDDGVLRALKQRAAAERKTISELVESALRLLLQERGKQHDLPPLPTFEAELLANVDDRDALYRAMEEGP